MEFDRKKLPTIIMIVTIIAIVIGFNVSYYVSYISANNKKIVDYDLEDKDINPIRETAVAGLFYPADLYQLDSDIDGYLEHIIPDSSGRPQIMIVPHAGYKYSAQVAAHAYKRLQPFNDKIKKVFLLGPSHRVYVKGVALSPAKRFKTPLGFIHTDRGITEELKNNKLFSFSTKAHKDEHSLEVQMPFLQKTLEKFTIIPMLYGDAKPEDIAKALKPHLERDDSILIISADLSHYLDYQTAQKEDNKTAEQIENSLLINHHQSCGATAINTAMLLARDAGLVPHLLNLANSGDVTDDKDRVVGYGAWVYQENESEPELVGIELEQRHLQNFARHNKETLFNIVEKSLYSAVVEKKRFEPQREKLKNVLFDKGASFVTLKKGKMLRGCIGSLVPQKAIAIDLADNTYAAALNDVRFSPVTEEEIKDLKITISLLTSFEEIEFNSYAELLFKIKPNIDGLLIKDGEREGIFLPAVWQEIPDKEEFLTQLKIKAGLSPSHWSNKTRVFRFRTVEIKNDSN